MGLFKAMKGAFGRGGGITSPDSPMMQPGFGQGLGVMDPSKVQGALRKEKMLLALGALGEVMKGYAGQDPAQAMQNMEPLYKRMQEKLQLYRQFGSKQRFDGGGIGSGVMR